MKLTTTLFATLSCTLAITLETTAKVKAEWGSFGDAFDDIGHSFDDAIDWAEDVLEDIGDIFFDGFDDLVDVAETVGNGQHIWVHNDWDWIWDNLEVLGDLVDWVADGDNWGALGKTLGTGALLALSGDFEAAGDLLGNEDLYTGEGYDEIERKKEEKAEQLAEHERQKRLRA